MNFEKNHLSFLEVKQSMVDFRQDWIYLEDMEVADLITANPEILGGTPVFKGTRVPVKSLFDYLERNYSLDEFIECFPSVTKEMARMVLERSEAALLAV